jgi:hypothetical protein
MALQALSTEALDELVRQYDEVGREVMGNGGHARLHALAERLVAVARIPAGGPLPAECGFCGGCA